MASVHPCEWCGSTDFEVVDGILECNNGHRQTHAFETAEDDQDYSRRGRLVKAKDKQPKQKISKVYRGKKAYQLYILGWQQILWKQCSVLIHEKGLPNELWSVVRDLWELRAASLTHRLDDTAVELNDDVGNERLSETELSDDDDDDTRETDVETAMPRRPRRVKPAGDSPKLIDTISLNYIGMLLLRAPVSLETLYHWVRKEDVPFMRAIRHVDEEIKEHMPGEYHDALDTNYILQPSRLQIAVYDLAQIYSTSFGMNVPPLNHTHILHQYIRRLTLPIEVIPFLNNLNTRILHFDFQYPSNPPLRRTPLSYPEAQLITLLVISTKLLYPFPSNASSPLPSRPSLSLQLSWPAWLSLHQFTQIQPKSDSLERGKEIEVTDHDVLTMSDAQMDQYMDWYQRTFIKHPSKLDQAEGVDKVIAGLFPLADIGEVSAERKRDDEREEMRRVQERVVEAVRTTTVTAAIDGVGDVGGGDGSGNREAWGRGYQRFQKEDELGEARGVCRVFHEEAAKVACLDLNTLLRAVWQAEVKLLEWQRERKREDAFAETMDIDSDLGQSE